MLAYEQVVQGLERFDPAGAGVLTVYMRTDPSRESGRNRRAQLGELLRPLRGAISDPAAVARFDSAAERARGIMEGAVPASRSAAAFICEPRGLEVVVPIPDPIAPAARWEPRLYLRPLLAALDEHERALVVLVDKARARLFHVCMGQIEEIEAFEDDVPGHQRAGRSLQRAWQGPHVGTVGMGYDAPTIERHHLWHVRQHVDRVIAALARADRPAIIDRVFLAGPVEVVSELRRVLPGRLRGRVAAELRIPLFASPAEVLEGVSAAAAEAERASELALARELMERPAHARLGATAVAEAVADHAVHSLVYAAGASLVGAECDGCGWILVGERDPARRCPRCGGGLVRAHDLIDLMVARVLERGGRVEEVRGEAAERLTAAEGIGALLRWSGAPAVSSP